VTGWESVRAVADAVLYEGYLLYPYRATSDRNRSRWQFGVLGPPGAADAGLGEDDRLSAQFLVREASTLTLVVRFLHLQRRRAERRTPAGDHLLVDELVTPAGSWMTWDEAVEAECNFGPVDFSAPADWSQPITAAAATEIEDLDGGRLVRERQQVTAELALHVAADGPVDRVTVTVRNIGSRATDKADAIARSMIGTHVIAATDGAFVSLLDTPDDARNAASRCHQHRCFPVLAGPPGSTDLLLASPIILYDHPEIAEQSRGALYDACEIDEILTLRVMTMTDAEKAQARATDPRAARIIDQCDGMSPEEMLNLHGVLRDPQCPAPGLMRVIPEIPDGVEWWDPLADSAVRPELDAVLVAGVPVSRGSRVRLRPNRGADAQDMFVAGLTARVTVVHEDVDGAHHVGVVLDDDPAADLHDSYGRYLYFSPDEIEPLAGGASGLDEKPIPEKRRST
jgi:hypothetical protein